MFLSHMDVSLSLSSSLLSLPLPLALKSINIYLGEDEKKIKHGNSVYKSLLNVSVNTA